MSFDAFLSRIESPELRVLAKHWQSVRGGELMPGWADLDPVQIGRSLRYVWAWKYDRDNDSFTGRLAGEEIVQAFGKSPRGVEMSAYFSPEIYRVFFPWQRRVVLEPACLHGSGQVYHRLGRNFRGERIIMPLATDGAKGDGIVGATFYHMDVGEFGDLPETPDFSNETVVFYPLAAPGS